VPVKHPHGLERHIGGTRTAEKMGWGVTTKVQTNNGMLGQGKGELRASHVRDSVAKSLESLRTSRVKCIVAQRQDSDVSVGELTGVFHGLVDEGLCEMVSFVQSIHPIPFWGSNEICTRRVSRSRRHGLRATPKLTIAKSGEYGSSQVGQ
jgi:aryl-alcohol dehydrogenase-like predicted oxidoreductase